MIEPQNRPSDTDAIDQRKAMINPNVRQASPCEKCGGTWFEFSNGFKICFRCATIHRLIQEIDELEVTKGYIHWANDIEAWKAIRTIRQLPKPQENIATIGDLVKALEYVPPTQKVRDQGRKRFHRWYWNHKNAGCEFTISRRHIGPCLLKGPLA